LVRVSDILALERKARLASERSVEACAGLEWKSQNIGREWGRWLVLVIFMPPF
jgi:hypothetical protein